jgi:hypothetical protein
MSFLLVTARSPIQAAELHEVIVIAPFSQSVPMRPLRHCLGEDPANLCYEIISYQGYRTG